MFILLSFSYANDGGVKRLLFISSYHPSFPTFPEQIRGLREVFDTADVRMQIEFLDSKRFSDEENSRKFIDHLYYKLLNSPKFNIILVSDDNAFNLVMEHHKTVFSSLPVVFCGVANVEKALEYDANPLVTGLVEDISIYETLKLMIELFPDSKNVYAISDNTYTGLENIQKFYALHKKFKNKNFIEINTSNYSEVGLSKKLASIPKKDLVLLLSNYHLKKRTISFKKAMQLINSNLKAPVFHLWYFGLGTGVLGGKMISHYSHIKEAALIALQVIKGTPIAEFKVVNGSKNNYYFDKKVMNKFHLDYHQLPENSQVVNDQSTFFSKYKFRILLVLLLILVLISLVVFLINNIEKRKKIEIELVEAKERAELSDKLKTEFINNMSHEVRTPLNGIIGFTEILDNEKDSKNRNNYLKIIKESGKQLLKIIEDILEISRLETNQVVRKDGNVSINELIYLVYQNHKTKAEEKGLVIKMHSELSDKDSVVKTDRNNVLKVINSLVDNAIRFTHKGSISIGCMLKDQQLFISVEDTGIGISEEKKDVIFESFSQEEKELEKNVGGLGLGLSIAQKCAHLIDGQILLQSEKNKGTVFTLVFDYRPVYISNQGEYNSKEDLMMMHKTDDYTVLVAEDEEINFMFLEVILKNISNKLKIIRAKNGKEAVEICKKNFDIDLILMDIKMPEMSGLEATRIIKGFNQDVPIIAQSAYTSSADKQDAFIAGCCDYVTKPINRDILSDVIRKYIEV
jgi:signal transduction histidine kinase/CheY-like chemotaxis protein